MNWGPHAWKFLHAVSFAYPDNPSHMTKLKFLTFFKILRYVLPCATCRRGYTHESQDLSIKVLQNKDTLSRWLVNVHNKVNIRLSKKVRSYDDIKKLYLKNS
jgi:hypothetical protein